MSKIDFKKTMPSYKAKHGRFDIVDVPVLNYLMINGANGPASLDFAEAIQTLYPVAYTLKFMSKLELRRDYVVPPLEALWWAEDMTTFTTNLDKSAWQWTAMIMSPQWITPSLFEAAIDAVNVKKTLPCIKKLRLVELEEHTSVQTLHIGPFDNEGPVLKEMHETFIPNNGFEMQGKHHEIYFNDFRKTAPEKLRTLLRQPVALLFES